MGRQKGLVHLTGQYGDVQLSINADGVPVAKFAQPVRRNKVKKGDNYKVTRKNNDEFTASAYSASSLRRCMGERIRQFADRHLTARLIALAYGVIAKGPGMAGQRTFEVGANRAMLRRVEASKLTSLTSRFQAPFTVTANADRNTAVLDVPAFATDNFLSRPQGATHFKLLLVAGVLSDFEYTGGTVVYEPSVPDMNGLSIVASSLVLPAIAATNPALLLTAAVPGLPVLPSTACLIVSVGIEFLRVINGYEEVLASGNALRVVEVF